MKMIYHSSIVVYLFFPLLIETISDVWQSLTSLSSIGSHFSPLDEPALLLLKTNSNTLLSCTQLCHLNIQCRIFDYDSQSHQCRLFRGDLATMGSIVSSSNSSVGSIQIRSEQYVNYDQSCSECLESRYLQCVNGSCQCPLYTFFDGSICQSEKILGSDCNSSSECRTDLNYICLPRMQCARKFSLLEQRILFLRIVYLAPSIETATLSAGNSDGTSGSGLSSLNYPTGVFLAIDNSLYLAECYNNRVLKFAEGSSIGSIVAGSSPSQLNCPTGIYVDTSYHLYIADSSNYRIMLWQPNASSGIQIAGTGSAGSSLNSFNLIGGLYVDSQGNVYISDIFNHRVLRFSPNTTDGVIVAGITGSNGFNTDQLNYPFGIYVDDINSYLYVADSVNHRIQRIHLGVSTNGTTVAGGNNPGSASNQLNNPYTVTVSKKTNGIYIADIGNNRIQLWHSQSTSGVTIAGNGALITNTSTSLQGQMDIKLNENETSLFVCEMSHNRVWRFTLV